MTTRQLSRVLIATLLALSAMTSLTSVAQTPASSPAPAECVQAESGEGCLDLAPTSARVDLAEPVFSNPTQITNPLFPISEGQTIQVGTEAYQTLRIEITLLPETKAIEWNGQTIDAAVSQYVAYRGGAITEKALDYYAQADDGSVWYLGEDVDNYEDGEVADHEGTWLAGKDGPPGMIMPADPQVGDVFRPENIPGLVFEEVTVLATEVTVQGPQGKVDDAILTEELLMDNSLEHKFFAPGYGEFEPIVYDEHAIVAMAVPIDALEDPLPTELSDLSSGSLDVIDAISSGEWETAAASADSIISTWESYSESSRSMPLALKARMEEELIQLQNAVDAQDSTTASGAAFNMVEIALDLSMQFRPLIDVELDRMNAWSHKLAADADADKSAAVAGDVAALEAIWSRVSSAVDQATANTISGDLDGLRSAVESGDMTAVADATSQLQEDLGSAQSVS